MKTPALVVSFVIALVCLPAFAADPIRPHSVDYLIGMLEAGVTPGTIVNRIHKESLAFRIDAGDLDRLKAAGADDALLKAVEEAGAAGRSTPAGAAGEKGNGATQIWGRPQRLAEPQDDAAAGGDASADTEAGRTVVDDSPHGGYPYYRPGDDDGGYDYYPYSYSFYYGVPYYDPFYIPYYYPFYGSYYRFHSPYYYYYGPGYRTHRWSGGMTPRGSGRFLPRGSSGRPSSPRGHAGPRGHH